MEFVGANYGMLMTFMATTLRRLINSRGRRCSIVLTPTARFSCLPDIFFQTLGGVLAANLENDEDLLSKSEGNLLIH